MCIVPKVGIVSNLFSNTINHKLRHCLLTPVFKDFFFSFFRLHSCYKEVNREQVICTCSYLSYF